MVNRNIKAVVFDFSGVIELYGGSNVSEHIADFLQVPIADFRNEFFKYNHLCNVGTLRWEEVIIKAASFFDKSQETKHHILSLIKESQAKSTINSELVAMFPTLRQQGLKVAIFSNHGATLREKLSANGIINFVDEVVISIEIGFQKPHKEAFQVLFEKLGVGPEEVVFIDDTPKSLEKSGEIGYVPILFKSNSQLKNELQNLGISV